MRIDLKAGAQRGYAEWKDGEIAVELPDDDLEKRAVEYLTERRKATRWDSGEAPNQHEAEVSGEDSPQEFEMRLSTMLSDLGIEPLWNTLTEEGSADPMAVEEDTL